MCRSGQGGKFFAVRRIALLLLVPFGLLGPQAAGVLSSPVAHAYDARAQLSRVNTPAVSISTTAETDLPAYATAAVRRASDVGWSTMRAPAAVVAAEEAASLGSTGRTVAESLKERLAMDEAMSNPAAGTRLPITMTDARWPAADGWVKMSQNVNGIEIHYVQNTTTGAVDDFKFIGGPG
jgi:hypothetical protein